jgi:hypothetical protein
VTGTGTTGISDIQRLVRVPLEYRIFSYWYGYHWNIGHSVTGVCTTGISDIR